MSNDITQQIPVLQFIVRLAPVEMPIATDLRAAAATTVPMTFSPELASAEWITSLRNRK